MRGLVYVLVVAAGSGPRVAAAAPGYAPAVSGDAADEPAAAAVVEGPVAAPVAAPAARLPAVEVTTAKRVRHDWYVGFGLGVGAGNVRTSGGGAAVGAAMTGVLRGGGRLTDKVAMGALAVTSFGGGQGGVRGFSNLLAEALFFPVAGKGLGLSVGLGVSSAWTRRSASDGTAVDVDRTRLGVAFSAGVGYDFWLLRRFNLGLWLRADGSAGPVYGLRTTGTLGLAFTWY